MDRPFRVLCFEGLPASFVAMAKGELQKAGRIVFLCLMGVGEPSEGVRNAWEKSVQPDWPDAHLFVLRTKPGSSDDDLRAFVAELAARHREIDLLVLADDAGLRSSRRLAVRLERLSASLPESTVVRRV
ncbi:MAG: hypothetical protein JST30_07040 [Armatimonadetes bacterium]|nr:hypothetical protein [Armatimonadota bacterium]